MLVSVIYVAAYAFARLRVELIIAGLINKIRFRSERIVIRDPLCARLEHRQLVLLALEVRGSGQRGGLGLHREREVLLGERPIDYVERVENGILSATIRDSRVRMLATPGMTLRVSLAGNLRAGHAARPGVSTLPFVGCLRRCYVAVTSLLRPPQRNSDVT